MKVEQIIFLDIDGTLINAEKKISPLSRKVIKQLESRSEILIVLISARMPKSLVYICSDLDIPKNIISFNGAVGTLESFENHQIKLSAEQLLSPSLALTCYKCCKDYDDMTFNIYTQDTWLANELNRWTQREIDNTFVKPDYVGITIDNLAELTTEKDIYKILIRSNKENLTNIKSNLYAAKVDKLSNMIATRDTLVEVTPMDVHKGTAVKKIGHWLGIEAENMMAFGDADNDIEMIKEVKYGYAVKNASDSLKNIAYEVIASNSDDGVVKQLIKSFGLKA